MAIIALVLGVMVPAVGTFFDSTRVPDARNLISASLTNARNYAVANSASTALVFVEHDDGDTRRTLMFLAEHDGSSTLDFNPIVAQEVTHLPDNIIISADNETDPDAAERDVIVCFMPTGQLTTPANIDSIDVPDLPDLTNVPSVSSFYLYDSLNAADSIEQVHINYYTGAVIEE